MADRGKRGQDVATALRALHGEALSERESRRVTTAISKRFQGEVKQLSARRAQARKQVKPLVEKLATEHERETARARAAIEAASSVRVRVQNPPVPEFPSGIYSGSLVAVFAPPYDWGDQHGEGEIWGDANTGELHFNLESIAGGSASADAEIGKWFRPITDGIVRFRCGLTYSYSWDDQSLWYTAHNDAFVGAYIYEHTSQGALNLLADNRVSLWSDGTGWLDHHSGSNDGVTQFFDIPFFADGQSDYFLGIWCGCSLDSDGGFGGFSNAQGELTGRVPVIAVKS